MTTRHIAFLSPVGSIGGAERVLVNSIRQIRKRRPTWQISVVLMGTGPLENELARQDVQILVEPLPPSVAATGDSSLLQSSNARRWRQLAAEGSRGLASAPQLIGYRRRLARLLRTLRPNVIISNGLKAHLTLSTIDVRPAAAVWHVHDFFSERPLVRTLVRLAPRRPALAIAISDAVAADFTRLLPQTPVDTIENGVDTEQFCPGPADDDLLDRLSGPPVLDKGALRVGLVATFATWKGHDVFLRALARVPEVHGYIVGGPVYATRGSQTSVDELRRMAAELQVASRVSFIPFQNDPAPIYRALDVVVHASTRPEPFGLTIVEAMACGRSVVIAAGGGAATIVTPDVDGLWHMPGDVEGLAKTISTFAADRELRSRLGDNARQTALRRFSVDRFGTGLVASLESACVAASGS